MKRKKTYTSGTYRDLFEFIVTSVCKEMHVDVWDVFIDCRERGIADARQVTQCIIKETTELSLEAIGYLTGRRGHSTIITTVRAVSNRLDTDAEFRELYDGLLKAAQGFKTEQFVPSAGEPMEVTA